MLEGTLLVQPGWYANFQSPSECWIVFAHGRVFAMPEPQLDWTL